MDRLVASEAIEKQIDKVLSAAVAQAIERELSSYSDFGKLLDLRRRSTRRSSSTAI